MAVRTGVAILAMAVHLSIPVLHNVGGFLQSIAIVQANDRQDGLVAIIDRIQQMNEQHPLAAYGRYTGMATGYGFFAPHVASPFVLQAVVCQPGSPQCDTLAAPPGFARNTAVRYRAFTSGMRNLLPETWQHYGTDPLAVRYTRALVRQTAQQWAARCGAELVSFSVYAVRLPTLRQPGIQYVDLYAGD